MTAVAAEKKVATTTVGLIELRLGCSLTTTTKRLVTDLNAISESVRCIRNAYVWYWLRWREDHPDFQPDKGELMSSEATKAIYRRLCDENPAVASSIVACCMSRELKALNSAMPYNHTGKARKRWQALLLHEANPPSCKAGIIPLHNRTIRLCYAGDMFGSVRGPVASKLEAFGQSSFVVALQLFSRTSGRPLNNFVRAEVRQLPAGKRKVLRFIARGDEWKVRDSLLVFKEKEQKWFLQLTYKRPYDDLGLNSEKIATLQLADKDAEQPFVITLGEGEPTWNLGFRILEREYNNLNLRRRHLRTKYRVAGSGRRGHGRERVEYRLRKVTHKAHDLMERFTDCLVADAMKFCVRNDAGTIDYREPALQARTRTWFAKRRIQYDWTTLLAKLKQKCTLHKIALLVNGEEM